MLLNFLSNLCIPPCVGYIFRLMVFAFLENALNLGIFNHASPRPFPLKTRKGRGKFLIASRQTGVEGNMICFIRIQLEKVEVT